MAEPAIERMLIGAGEMRARIRDHDWSRSAVGHPSTWPASLCSALAICLGSRSPMIVWWGRDLNVFYNDACIPIFGGKHPAALGQPALSLEAWGDEAVRAVIEPMLLAALERGEATWAEDQPLILSRNGFPEETYLTWSFSPIPDEVGGVGGV